MEIFLLFLGLIISIFVLIKGADLFIEYAEKLGMILGISQFIIGITIISLGTSLPELITSLLTIYKNTGLDIDITNIISGNIIGSNIANILLVGGFAFIFSKTIFNPKKDLLHIDMPVLLSATVLFFLMSQNEVLCRFNGILLIIGYLLYMFYIVSLKKDEEVEFQDLEEKDSILKCIILIILGGVLLFLGSYFTIEFTVSISEKLNIDQSIISLSIIAIGTSLPELIVSVKAAKKGNFDMAIGNIFGSNMFNILLIGGISSIITNITMPSNMMVVSILLGATLLFAFSSISKKISKWEGAFFLLLYIYFIYQIIEIG